MVEVDDVRRKVGAGNPVTEDPSCCSAADDREALIPLDVSVLPGITDDPLGGSSGGGAGAEASAARPQRSQDDSGDAAAAS